MDIGINLVCNVYNTINWYFRFFQFNSNATPWVKKLEFQLEKNYVNFSIECFPLTYDLNGFKFRINRYLLIADSF